jgi:hypothetical protein
VLRLRCAIEARLLLFRLVLQIARVNLKVNILHHATIMESSTLLLLLVLCCFDRCDRLSQYIIQSFKVKV